jgi:2-haloacid dehalogenase
MSPGAEGRYRKVRDRSVTEALAFDLYGTLVDPIAISADLARALGISDGGEVARLWRLKQLEYSFRLTVMDRYQDFRHVTERALGFALASAGLSLPSGQLSQLAGRYDQLPPFPDAEPALRSLTDLGYQLAVLSNGTPGMIQNCLASSGLGGYFAQQISADEIRAFKPSPLVYRHAAQRLARPVHQIRLVSSNAFDSAGASAAGMRTAWVNRSGAPFDTIGSPPEITVPSLSHLPAALHG